MPLHLGRLLWKIEGGHPLDDADREYLADLVRKKIKRPDPRPARTAKRQRDVVATVLNYELEHGCGREAAVQRAMEVHGVGREYVFGALAELRDSPIATEIRNVAGVQRRFVQGRDGEWREVDPH